MIVNPSVTKPKGVAASTHGSQAKQQRRYTIAEISSSVEAGDEGDGSTCHRPSTRISRRRSSTRSASDKVEEICIEGRVKSSKDHGPPTYVRFSRRRSSIHIAPEKAEEIRGMEEGKGGSSRISRRRSSILIAPEKAEEIRICVEGNSFLNRERLEEKRARLDQEQLLLVAKRKSLIERWEKETLNNLQVKVDQHETKGFHRVRGILSKIGGKGEELMADSRQALSGLKNVRPNRVNASLA
jgi:hypothetical protein